MKNDFLVMSTTEKVEGNAKRKLECGTFENIMKRKIAKPLDRVHTKDEAKKL